MPKRPKQVPKDPAQLENLWGEVNSQHLESYQNARRFVEKLLEREEQQLESGTFDMETQRLEPYAPDMRSILALISAVRLCIDGERTALNLELLSDSRAIAKVQQLGYTLMELPSESVD